MIDTTVKKEAASILRKGAAFWSGPEKHLTGRTYEGPPDAPTAMCSMANIWFQARGGFSSSKMGEVESPAETEAIAAVAKQAGSPDTKSLCALNNRVGYEQMKEHFTKAAETLETETAG